LFVTKNGGLEWELILNYVGSFDWAIEGIEKYSENINNEISYENTNTFKIKQRNSDMEYNH
jgi:hypothetical protein